MGRKDSFTINSGPARSFEDRAEVPKRTTRTTIDGRHVRNSRVLSYAARLRKALSLDGHPFSTTGPLVPFGGSRV